MAAARATGVAVVVLLLAFLTLPSLVVIVVSFNPTAIMAFPPHGLSLRWYENALTYPQFQRAAVNSLIVTAAATLLALPIGTAAALALVRHRVAASLGARPSRVFRRVTLPLLRPGLAAAALFAVIVSVNEFVVSLFVSTRVTEILPVAMFTYVVNYTDPTMAALSTLFIAATFAAVLVADRFLDLSSVFQITPHR